jgi:hypothetical protein
MIVTAARQQGASLMRRVFKHGKKPCVTGDLNSAIAVANAGLQLVRLMEVLKTVRVEWRFDPDATRDRSALSQIQAIEALNAALANLIATADNHLPDNRPDREVRHGD